LNKAVALNMGQKPVDRCTDLLESGSVIRRADGDDANEGFVAMQQKD